MSLKIKMVSHKLQSEKIAIIAGGGKLPQLVTDELIKHKVPFIILSIHNNAEKKWLDTHKHFWIHPTKVKPVLKIMSDEKITSVVLNLFDGDYLSIFYKISLAYKFIFLEISNSPLIIFLSS